MMDIIPTGVIDLIVVDSTSSLQPEQEFSGHEPADYGTQARALKGFRTGAYRVKVRHDTIFINQIRDTMAMYENQLLE